MYEAGDDSVQSRCLLKMHIHIFAIFLGRLLILAADYSEKKTRTSKAFSVALGRSKLTDWSDTRTRVHIMSINFFLMHSSNFCESFRS